jgi:hypothetical protein
MNTAKIQLVQKVISQVAGINVELTIRGLREFTFHYEGKNDLAMKRICNYFKGTAKIECEYDIECDYSCVFIEC